MSEKINRSRHLASTDPNERLAAVLGEAFRRYRRAWAEAEKGLRPAFPLHLDVDVTTACNFACPMCPAGNSGHIFPGFQKGRRLDFRLYQKALVEGADFGLPSLRLGLTGEPLLIPDISNWVEAARQRGFIDIALITNGRLLSPGLSRELIEAGLTRLMISVDAADEEIYSQVRPGGDWNLLLANIAAFLEAREKSGSVLPLLRLSFVEMNINRHQRRAFEERFAPMADYLSFQRYQNILGAEDTKFASFPDLSGSEKAAAGFCSEPFTRLALHVDGGLFPCCSDFGRQRPLANLTSGGIFAAWDSEAARALAGPGAAGAEPCRTCLDRAG